MGEREDGLGLTLGLSLKFPDQNLPPLLPFYLHSIFQTPKLSSLIDAFQSSPDARSNLRGIDVNRRPSTATECEDEVGMSSPNSTISSVSGKREENGTEIGWATGCGGEEEDDDGGDTAERKKLRLSKEQSALLEETFKEYSTLKPKQKVSLANQLKLRTRQVEVWFQNRRARTKLKQTEVDCEYLKRCYENLTEENRQLQKEANELRALKVSPQTYMHMNPPTTLTMCPSCERVAVLPPPSSAAASTIAPAAAAISITRHLMPVRSTPGIACPFNSNNSQAA